MYKEEEMIKIIGTGTPQQTHKTRPASERKNRYLKTLLRTLKLGTDRCKAPPLSKVSF